MKKKNQYKMKTKHLITMMTILCLGLIVLSLSTSFSFAPVRNVLGYVIVPFQNGINEVGNWMTDQKNGFQSMKKLSAEYDRLEREHKETYDEFKSVRDDLHRLLKVRSCIDTAIQNKGRTEEQMLQNRPQTRHKKEDMTL